MCPFVELLNGRDVEDNNGPFEYIDNDCNFIDRFNLIQKTVIPEQYRNVMKKILRKCGGISTLR